MREKLEAAQAELRKSGEVLVAVQQSLENERKVWAEDKKLSEDIIADMSSFERSTENARVSRQGEIEQLEERAKAAEEKYGREVVAHAESIKTMEESRQQLSETKLAVRDAITAAETAQAKLSTSETSWNQQKKALEREVSDLNVRYVTLLFVPTDLPICLLVARTSSLKTLFFTTTSRLLAHKLPRFVTLRTLLQIQKEKEKLQIAIPPSFGQLLDGCGGKTRSWSYNWNSLKKKPLA